MNYSSRLELPPDIKHIDYLTSLYSLYSMQSSTLRTIASSLMRLNLVLQTYILPPVDRLIRTLAAKPDVASVLLLILLLFVSLKLLNLLYNAIMWWIRLAIRLVFWGTIIGAAAWIYSRGPDGVAEDIQRLADVWSGEYSYWSARGKEGWAAATAAAGNARGPPGDGYQAYGRGRAAGGRW